MFKDKINKFFKNKEEAKGNENKKIENLVFFIIISVITIVIINFIWSGNKTDNKQVNENTNINNKKLANVTEENTDEVEDTNNLEEKLEEILSKIQGVGEVKVCVNYSESSEVVAMFDENSSTSTTEETDTEGGVRKIEQTETNKNVIYEENDGKKTPITTKVIKPKIEGAIITAKGANNAAVKNNIIQAVEALTGLATHKIQVFEMN